MPLGKPSVSDPRSFDLRALQTAVSNTRQRLEAIEAAILALQTGSASASAAALAALTARVDNIVLGNGTVTSVGATVPSFLSVSGTPITTAGTLAFNLTDQPAGFVFAGPVAGSDAPPSFRQLEWYHDLPLYSTASFTSGLTGDEIMLVERYGDFVWTTLRDIASLARLSVNSQSADYTLTQADASGDSYIRMSSASPLALIVPSNASVPLAVGSVAMFVRAGSGTLTVTPQSGVTVNTPASYTLNSQGSPGALVKVDDDEWDLFGDLT